jgi:Kef-type K+ transport system membrane component KefB
MEQLLICMSLSLIAGLLASRAAKAIRLPAVTSYLVAGLLLGPFFLGRLGLSGWGFGFGSLAQVESYGIITQVALGFIAFVIGNEFRLSALESMGRQAVTVGILQAVITTVLVDIALVALHFARPDVISMASAITLGAIASATAPAATLMVVKQYKASGPLTRLLLMVVAIDDAVGLVLFSASFGIANALEQGRIDPISILLEPLVEIVLSLGLGALAGLLLNQLEVYFHSRSKRMSLSVAFVLLTVGLSMVSFKVGPIHCSFSLLLVCMMTGTVFCNICPTSDELMDRLDRWVSPVNILFFVLSGAELDLNILANPMVLLIGAVYIASRSLGKISGSYVSCKATRCSEKIQKYLGITLLPQAGVALGMAAEAAELSDGHMVRNVVLFSVLVYELVGPTLAKISLTAAGEIIPEGRTYHQQAGGTGQRGLIFPISLTAGDGAILHYKSRCTVVTLCSGFLFALYFSTISSFSASTVRVEPETRVPSMIFSAAGSSTALRMVRRRSRAPNLPPWLLCTSAASAAGV